jgi:hypothetical protein
MEAFNIISPGAGHLCNCIGPQNGQPLCPCMMRNVHVKDGRYIEVIDHGPAPTADDPVEAFRRTIIAGV